MLGRSRCSRTTRRISRRISPFLPSDNGGPARLCGATVPASVGVTYILTHSGTRSRSTACGAGGTSDGCSRCSGTAQWRRRRFIFSSMTGILGSFTTGPRFKNGTRLFKCPSAFAALMYLHLYPFYNPSHLLPCAVGQPGNC
jgi:hypothetical protein